MDNKTILYIFYKDIDHSSAAHINTQRRIHVLKHLGFTVTEHLHGPKSFFLDLFTILNKHAAAPIIMIRIDGSGVLDKFTLLKLLLWRTKIVWEIHGFPDENFPQRTGVAANLTHLTNSWKRKILSFFVDSYIFISKELQSYAVNKILHRPCYVVSNFISTHTSKPIIKDSSLTLKKLFSNNFVVLWGGGANYPWQAIDTIESVAKKMYAIDASVLFILIGTHEWHTLHWSKNILKLGPVPYDIFQQYILLSNVCLALYHKPASTPFYFMPMKILDYMARGKPVIATEHKSIKSIVCNMENGFLTTNSPKRIISIILRLKNDSRLAKRIGDNAKQTIQSDYSFSRAKNSYSQILNKTLT